jgi:hypothetical protein
MNTSFGWSVYPQAHTTECRHQTFLRKHSLAKSVQSLDSRTFFLLRSLRTSQSNKLVHYSYRTVYENVMGTFTAVRCKVLRKVSWDVTPFGGYVPTLPWWRSILAETCRIEICSNTVDTEPEPRWSATAVSPSLSEKIKLMNAVFSMLHISYANFIFIYLSSLLGVI